MSAGTLLAQEGGKHFEAPGLELFQFDPAFHVFGFPVTKPMLLSVFAALVVCVFFYAAFAKPRLVPRRVQNLGELGVLAIRDQIARQVIGKDGDRYVPLLVTLFFFIWVMNLLSVIPLAQFPVTSRIAFPAVLAIAVYLIWVPLGIKRQGGWKFFKNMMFPPGVPTWAYFILTPVELVSNLVVRPFTHAVRLFANMFAGHVLLAIFSVATWYFIVENPGVYSFVGVVGFLMAIVMTGFEMFIQGLQAFIFTLLTAVYISSALQAEH